MKANLVVYGKVYTAEKENDGLCEAFAVKDGKYIYVGDRAGAADYAEEGVTKIIDNTGKGLIIPGCTEGHGHFIGIDALVRMMPGYFVADYESLLDLLRKKMNGGKKPEFFMSWGFDYIKFSGVMDPARNYAEEIEAIAPGIPVVMIDTAGHQALCNLTALRKAEIAGGEKVRGGNVYQTSDGVPNGLVSDELVPYVIERAIDLQHLDAEIYRTACKNAVSTLHQRGFTNYFDAYINYLAGTALYPYLKELDEKGELGINAATTYTVRSFEAKAYREKMDILIKEGEKYRTAHFDPLILKLFADGVVESKTGWVLGEYPNAAPGQEHGNIVWTPDELKEIAAYANAKGIPVHTHTYGDGACRAVIDAYIYAEERSGKKLHNTMAHVRNITPEDVRRCAEHDIGIAENMIWHCMDIPEENHDVIVKQMSAAYPEGIYGSGYPMKSLLDAGITLSSSTDAPAAESIKGNIQNIIEVAVTGITPGEEYRAYAPGELLTVREALQCLTIDGARQLGIGEKCGSVKEGKNADFVILDTDFLDFEGEALRTIHRTNIKNVYFEGREVL